jgi:Carbohydrate family 9 binding domain-like/FlgD Ig-like domain
MKTIGLRTARSLIVVMGAIVFFSNAATLPTYTCKMTKEAMTIDGVLNEKTWSEADTLKFKENTAGGTPLQATWAYAAWDSTNLYVAYVTQDNDIKGTLTQRDADLYTEEAVELFFDADTDQTTYIELEWNCLNAVWDGLIQNVNGNVTVDNSSWNAAGMVNAVKLRGTPNNSSDVDTGMTVEVKIPWKALDTNMTKKVALPPKNNDKMRINFYRIDQRNNVATQDLSAWSPTMNGSFHTPNKFGYITFSTAIPTAAEPRNGSLSAPTAMHSLSVKAVEAGRGSMRISYFVPERSAVRLTVSDAEGRIVKTLDAGILEAGAHDALWNCTDDRGDHVKSGVYSAVVQAGGFDKACLIPAFRW